MAAARRVTPPCSWSCGCRRSDEVDRARYRDVRTYGQHPRPRRPSSARIRDPSRVCEWAKATGQEFSPI